VNNITSKVIYLQNSAVFCIVRETTIMNNYININLIMIIDQNTES